jgi:glycosyltransferase involved in cell wall biosynthesis
MADVRERGLEECVRYLGPRRLEDLALEIAQCDVGVIPNQRNAFTDINTPTRIFEYLALGKPVIAPRTAGIEDYFGPESLLFFESGDAGELAERLLFVGSRLNEAVETAGRGQEVYLKHRWSQERQVLVDLVSGLLQERKPVSV